MDEIFNHINKVQLENGGLTGGKVVYLINEGTDKIYNNEIVKTNHAPTPREMDVEVDKLKIHALRICEIFTRDADSLYDFDKSEITAADDHIYQKIKNKLMKCRITGIVYDNDCFSLQFSYQRYDSNVFMRYSTENITDNYDYFDKVMEILRNIAPLAMKWVTFQTVGKKADVEFGIYMAENNFVDRELAQEAFDQLSQEDRDNIVIQSYEKRGWIMASPIEALEGEDENDEQPIEVEEKFEEVSVEERDTEDPIEVEEDVEETPFVENVKNKGVKKDKVETEEANDIVIPSIPGVKKA